MNVVEVAIQGCPIDLYIAPLVDSGLFLKVLATILDDRVLQSPRKLITGTCHYNRSKYEHHCENSASES